MHGHNNFSTTLPILRKEKEVGSTEYNTRIEIKHVGICQSIYF